MRFLSLLLCPMIALNPLWAQTNSAGPLESDPEAVLHVHVVDDPGPAQTRSTSAKGYVVQVTNASGGPVAGAAVALRLPEDGPTGRFANGLRAWVAYSDAAGIARFPVIRWGENAGPVQVGVTAAKGASHAGLMLAQQIGPENPSVTVVSVAVQAAAVVPKPAPPQQPQIAMQTPQPGAISKPLADTVPLSTSPMNISRSGTSAPSEKPHTLTPNPPPASATKPAVSITNSPTGAGGSSHKKLWILIAAVGAGAGVGALLALKGHGSNPGSGSTAGVSIGTPTVTVGH
jgi:hypothetical protein